MTVTEFLQTQVPFLAGLTGEQAHGLASQAEQKQFSAGQTVLFKGTTVEGLFVIATGKVTVWVKPPKGSAAVQVAELGPGEVFGETSILEMGTAGATIKAGAEDTLLFLIPQDAFRDVLAQNTEFQSRAEALVASRKKKNLELTARGSAEPVAA